MKKALIAMSGGVDSSVAAYITKSMGYDAIGCTMKLFEPEKKSFSKSAASVCGSSKDAEDAMLVSNALGMPHTIIDFSETFKEKVIDNFVKSYLKGTTPNPCIECNRYMKFDKLYAEAVSLGCEKIVTGHYARIEESGDGFVLKKAKDETKDQSYVLYNLNQKLLSHILFPLGSLSKNDVRKIAEEEGFINANKAESQDICFAPDGDYPRVIREYLENSGLKSSALSSGDFINSSGEILGRHKGIINYTIGQRKGLGISFSEPLYVCKICPEDNTVLLGSNKDLFSDTVYIKNINWISGVPPLTPIECKAKIRYRQKEQSATVYPLSKTDIKDIFNDSSNASFDSADFYAKIIFKEPQRAITPGQSAVFYDGDVVLGGGIII